MLDIIELEKAGDEPDDDDEDQTDLFNPTGYDELAQALGSVIWSNVDVNHGKALKFQLIKQKPYKLIV